MISATVGISGDSPTLASIPSSRLESMERELRMLREMVERLQTTIDSRRGVANATLDMGLTPPPDYASRRGRTEESVTQPLHLAIK